MAFLLRFFDRFLPESMCTNPQDLVRGYILVGMIFTNITISLFTAIGIWFLLDLEYNMPIALALDAVCLIAYPIALIMLKRTENYALCANFLLTVLITVTFYAVQITGGYIESPILQLALIPPVIAFLLLGLRGGISWLGLTLVLCMATYYSAKLNVGYTQYLQNEEVTQAMYILMQFVLVMFVGAVLIVYETLNGLLRDELQAEKMKLEHWASHDDLTGVPNRFEFFRRLKAHISEAEERAQNVGIVYIDLDGFKPINDTHGHHMGDEALRAVAERLDRVLRLSDTTARLGGDEFALILPGIRVPDDVETIMPKILQAIREPIYVDGTELVVHASCGVAIYPNHSNDYNDLCRYADAAMYRAKDKKNAYLVYEDTMPVQPAQPA
jgi:diguanylate cyclase (GGDEF)-like protein